MLDRSNGFGSRHLPPVILAVMVVVFFAPVLFTGRIMMLGDLCFYFYPGYVFLKERVWQGSLPLWSPYTGCGEPFLADIERGVFYPPNLTYLFLSVGTSSVIVALFHVLLAGLGTYALARIWRVSRMGSLLAGMTYALNSYTLTKLEFPAELGTAAWFPVVLSAYVAWLRSPGRYRLLVLSVAICLQFLAGFPESFTFCIGVLVLCAVYVGTYRGWVDRRWWSFVKPPLVLLGAIVVAILLSMAQFLPTWEAFQASTRAGEVDPRLDISSLHPLAIFSLIIPSIYGVNAPFSFYWGNYWAPSCLTYWVGAFYVGLVPMVIFLAVGIRRTLAGSVTCESHSTKDDFTCLRSPLFVTVFLIFLLYSMGRYTPVFAWLRWLVPPLQHFVSPTKSLLCVVLSLSCLSGIGIDWLALSGDRGHEGQRLWRRLGLRWALPACFLVVAVFVAICLFDDAKFGKALLRRFFNLSSVDLRYGHRIPWGVLLRDSVKFPVIGLITAVILHLHMSRPRQRHIALSALVLLSGADLYMTNAYLFPSAPSSVLDESPSRNVRLLGETEGTRFLAIEHFYVDDLRMMAAHLADHNAVDELDGTAFGASDQGTWGRYARAMRSALYQCWPLVDKAYNVCPFSRLASGNVEGLLQVLYHPDVASIMKKRLLAMLGCDRIVLFPDPKLLMSDGVWKGICVSRIGRPLPRAYVVGGANVLPYPDSVRNALAFKTFDPLEVALLERNGIGDRSLDDLLPGRVEHDIRRFACGIDSLEIEVESRREGLLVTSESHFPGWVATVNGQDVPIYKVNYAFRGVRVPAGASLVKMTYSPRSVLVGITVSLATAGFMVLLVIAGLKGRRASPPAETVHFIDTRLGPM